MIPANWTLERFGDIADYKAGRTPARANSEYWLGADDGVPWVSIADMNEFGTIVETKERISKAAFERVFRGIAVRAGTLIMSFKLTIGRVATLGVDACHNEAIIAIYPKRGVDHRFLGYFLSSIDYDLLQDRQVKGNTLNKEKIDRLQIWLPPFDEQSSIADVLDLIRHAIEIQDRIVTSVENLKRRTMGALFAEGLRGEPQKATEIGGVPESWARATLGDVSYLERGRFLHRPRNEPRFYGGATPFLQTGDVVRAGGRIRNYRQTLNEEGVAISRVFPAGTILITIAANIGYTGILQFDSACPDSLVAITPKDSITAGFLEYWLQTQQPQMDRLAPKGTQKNINIQFLSVWPVVVPSVEEQQDIVAVIEAVDRKVDLHRRKRAVLADLFKAILRKLMTGDISIADLDLSALETKPDASVEAA